MASKQTLVSFSDEKVNPGVRVSCMEFFCKSSGKYNIANECGLQN